VQQCPGKSRAMLAPVPGRVEIPFMTRSVLLVAVMLLAPPGAFGQEGDDDRDFDLPAADAGVMSRGGGVELDDIDFVGNPAGRLFSWWPQDLVLAPIPGYSPQLGWTLALGGAYFLSKQVEGGPPPSTLGGFVFGAENGSSAYGIGGKFNFMDDRLRVAAGAGYADIRYRYYGVGNDQNDLGIALDLLQNGPLYFGSTSIRVWKRLYLGIGYAWGNVETRPRIVLDAPASLFDPVLNLDIATIRIPVEWDSRDHEQFPRTGWHVSGTTSLFREAVGSDFDAETFELAVNRYLPMRKEDVLALRAYLRSTGGDAPFFLLSTFGGSKDLRGYPSGRYRDKKMYAVQAEYRWHIHERWILTGFAGIGEVAENFGDLGDNFLPAAGVGARFVLSSRHRVSLSVDVATGDDGTEFYFGVGEAF
jgi:hypothetical protein